MIIGVPRETYTGENRVALVPGVIPSLIKEGIKVFVELGAGDRAGFPDTAYKNVNARVLTSRADVFSSSDVIFQVRTVGANSKVGAN